jgi:hypothetical protein
MALINCPECGRQVSDQAKNCPGCGYEIAASKTSKAIDTITKKPLLFFAIIAVVICCIIFAKWDKDDYSPNRNNSYNSYSSGSTVNASTIFSNLRISNFSASLGKYSGEMRCEVLNNNSFTVHGYFYVNFYDRSGNLMYSQLVSLPSVASGEKVVCTKPIPKDSYPSGYSYVEYTQASLTKD